MSIVLSLWAALALAIAKAPTGPDDVLRPYQGVEQNSGGAAGLLLGVWQRFDTLRYLRIAAQGMLRGRLPRLVILSLFPVPLLLVASLWYQYNYAGSPRSPFRQANAYLRDHHEAGDAIVHENKLSFFPSYFYNRTLAQECVGDIPGSSTDTLPPGGHHHLPRPDDLPLLTVVTWGYV